MLRLYTDGSVLKEQHGKRAGGWSFSYRDGDRRICVSGGVSEATNNTMEMLAVIKGFRYLLDRGHDGKDILIVSDSQYVIYGASEWSVKWKRFGWCRDASGSPLANADLWKELDVLAMFFETRWKWVRGHNGHAENEFVDDAARKAAYRAQYIRNMIMEGGPE